MIGNGNINAESPATSCDDLGRNGIWFSKRAKIKEIAVHTLGAWATPQGHPKDLPLNDLLLNSQDDDNDETCRDDDDDDDETVWRTADPQGGDSMIMMMMAAVVVIMMVMIRFDAMGVSLLSRGNHPFVAQ